MSRPRLASDLRVAIPYSRFDGRPFAFFLDANGVEYYIVQAEGSNETEYVFATLVDRMNASTIWRTLTGSEVLGRFLAL